MRAPVCHISANFCFVCAIAKCTDGLSMPSGESTKFNGKKAKDVDTNVSRRSFVGGVSTSVAGITSSVLLGDMDPFTHVEGCECTDCGKKNRPFGILNKGEMSKEVEEHATGCVCSSCNDGVSRFGPRPAFAVEEKNTARTKLSPEGEAWDIQSRETISRLKADGFKIDSKEEEDAKIKDAFSSFSYESSTTTKQQQQQQRNSKKKKTSQ